MDLGRTDDEEAAVGDFAAAQELSLDDFFTFAVRRTDALDDADDFQAIRFHVTAELAGRVFDQFVVDVGFADSISSTPDPVETSDLLSFAGIERTRVPALPHYHDLIAQSSRPGELVLDPFCGSVTTGIAARTLNRRALLCDITTAAAADRLGVARPPTG